MLATQCVSTLLLSFTLALLPAFANAYEILGLEGRATARILPEHLPEITDDTGFRTGHSAMGSVNLDTGYLSEFGEVRHEIYQEFVYGLITESNGFRFLSHQYGSLIQKRLPSVMP